MAPAAALRGERQGGGAALGPRSGPSSSSGEEFHFKEYRVYVESILRPLKLESLRAAAARRRCSAREALEEAIALFVWQLKGFVVGCDDRKLSKAALRRARGIEAQLSAVAERLLVAPLQAGVLSVGDLHGIWHGFTVARGWRDSRVPQDCFLQMLRGALAEADEAEAEQWTEQALTWELTLPEVHQAIPVSAWPSLCELLGRLPDDVTPAELQEALWQQSFVENPTHAPDHRNYRRFAVLAAQMVAIGVELESDKVELLVQQALDLERPWRERRDMLSGILSAASVEDRRAVVRSLDRRFEEHADIDDFEIVCGIAEHIGIEIPREGAIRRCALRRWALDPKRGGALPVARLIDFVDMDAAIGEDVAASLRQRGRVADAALLLSHLPQEDPEPSAGGLDVFNGDAELARLRELLSLDDEGAMSLGREGVFGPVEEGAFRLPFASLVGYSDTAAAALEAAGRLRASAVLAVGVWREEAPFWHSPLTLLALCSQSRAELFDLVALRTDCSGGWPEAANAMRALLSEPRCLKVAFGDDLLHVFAAALGLGVPSTLKRGDREPLGPYLDLRALMASVMGCATDDPSNVWPVLARRFLGMRLCLEEAGSNWSRRPLRASQLHHAVVECWTQLPVLRAICAHGIAPPGLVRRHLCVQAKVKSTFGRARGARTHALGQLAPPGRLAWSEPGQAQAPAAQDEEAPGPRPPPAPTRVARLAAAAAGGEGQEELPAGALVEVLEEHFGGLTSVVPLGGPRDAGGARRLPSSMLRAANGWECPAWVDKLPRPKFAPPANASDEAPTPVGREALALALMDSLFKREAARQLLQWSFDAQQPMEP